MESSIRKALGYTDDQVITILIALKDDIRWMKKNRPQLMEDIIAYLGITEEELATARHKRNITKHMAEEHASLVVSGRIRPIAVLIDSAKRSGPSEQEQREAMETIKERVSVYIRPTDFLNKDEIMKKILLDYLHKRFESPSSKTAKKGVSPASFAIFLRGFLPYLEDFRKFVFGNNAMVSYSNEETGEHWTLDDLETALDTGLTLVASEVSSEQETGAELVMNVAKRGRVAAVLLYAAHFLADSGKKAETEQAKVWLYGIMYERAEDSQEYSIAKALLDSYLNNSHENPIPPEPTDAEWEDYYDKHYASIVDTSEGIVGLSLGDVVHGRADIGNVVIICGWFERLSNIIVKDSYIEAYFAPCLPTWYAIHLLVEKVGKEKLNDLAGERLYRDDIEDEPSPVLLQYPLEGDSIVLTHYIQPGSVLSFGYASVIISSTESEEVLFEADEEYDNVWHFSIPEKWDYTSAPVQRRLIRAMKSKIAIIAQMTLPQRCQILLKDHGLPNGQCRVSLIDEYWTKDNAEGGIDITVPFSLIQFPESVVDAVLLSGYDNNEQSLDKIRKRWYDGIVDGYSTTFGSKKLADKKLKFYPDVFFFI